MDNMFKVKKANCTAYLISTESGDPKRLWCKLNAALGLSVPEVEIPHTASEFTNFFADKVSRIRALTDVASVPVFSAAPSCTLIKFELLSEKDVANLVMKSPSKHSLTDPILTWLLKQCVSLLTPFITLLINASITNCFVPEA